MIDTERLAVMAAEHAAMRMAIHTLFAVGGAAGDDPQKPMPLPVACRRDGDWQSPGTVAVRVDMLRRLAKAGGVS